MNWLERRRMRKWLLYVGSERPYSRTLAHEKAFGDVKVSIWASTIHGRTYHGATLNCRYQRHKNAPVEWRSTYRLGQIRNIRRAVDYSAKYLAHMEQPTYWG